MARSDRDAPAERRILRFDAIPSTQDVIRAEGLDGAPAGTIAVARHQTAGRGRRGRTWSDPGDGMLMLSYLARPPHRAEALAPLPLVAGIAVVDALPVAARLHWPNDVVIDGAKVAGILVEGIAAADPFAIIGIGINANVPPEALPPTDRLPAGSLLGATGTPIDLVALETRLLDGLDAVLADFAAHGFAALHARYAAIDALHGNRVLLRTPSGSLEGTVRGVDAEGRLLLEDAHGAVAALTSAEVERVVPTP